MDFPFRSRATRITNGNRRFRRMTTAAMTVTVVMVTALGAGLAPTTAPASASAGGLPVIRSVWEQAHADGWPREEMFVRLHVGNATSVSVVRMLGYYVTNNPNLPLDEQKQYLAVVAGPLTLNHTGPGNLWQAHSYNKRLVKAVAAIYSTIITRACNSTGCVTHTFHASLLG